MGQVRGVFQSEAAECGLACLATCLRVLGSDASLSSLRYKFQTSSRGLTLQDVASMGAALDLTTRAVRCDVSEIRDLKLPAILHWKFNHFVVLRKALRNGGAQVFDPACGERTLSESELCRDFTGIALEVSASSGFSRRNERSPLSIFSLFSIRGSILSALVQALLLSLLLQLYTLGSPFFLQLAIDEAALKSDLGLLATLAIAFGAFAIFNSVAEALRGLTIQYAGAMLGWEMSTRLFHHMVRLPLAWFQRRKLADALTRFDSLEPIRALISGGLVSAVIDGALSITLLIMMFVYASSLAWVAVLCAITTAAIKLISTRRSIELGRQAFQASISEKGKRIETLRAIQTIKLLGGEVMRETDWSNKFGESVVSSQKGARFQIILKSTYGAIESISLVVVIYLGCRTVIGGGISIGMLYAFLSYRQQFSARIATLVDQMVAWRLLDIHSDRLADIALQRREPGTDVQRSDQAPLRGAIELRQVSYRYSEREPVILKGVSLTVDEGELVAIVGASGSGKSTLLKVLTGLYAPSDGMLLFDGVSAETLGSYWIRRHIGVVMQDDEMLSGSIAENVCFFAESPDFSFIWECLETARLADDVRKMPMQLHTLLGDMGSTLSGGQRQRLLLARALYRRPRILILDEATSNLDVSSERSIHSRLQEMSMTRIFVTHRPEAAKLADRILMIENGRLLTVDPPVPDSSEREKPGERGEQREDGEVSGDLRRIV